MIICQVDDDTHYITGRHADAYKADPASQTEAGKQGWYEATNQPAPAHHSDSLL